jgi:Holliday junction resolvase RusA-like endonuclease
MKIVIGITPITKKNHQQIIRVHGKRIIIPSKQYRKYEKDCAPFLLPYAHQNINERVNVCCKYYMPTKRRVDLTNLLNSTLDLLVQYGIILDDNRNIVYSVDGSRVLYDKAFPRTEIEITPITESVESWVKK